MKIYLATDHAGFELKNKLSEHLKSQGYEVVDKGPFEYDQNDDYPDFIRPCAEDVANNSESLGIILGGSGQGEAMCANRVRGVRTGVYYGKSTNQQDMSGNSLDMIESLKQHNNANILSLGARFMEESEVFEVVKKFIETPFTHEERHVRRIEKLEK